MMGNLSLLMKRGEKIDELQKKTLDLKTTSYSYKKKTKKMNSFWSRFGMCCSGPTNDTSRGGNPVVKPEGSITKK